MSGDKSPTFTDLLDQIKKSLADRIVKFRTAND
jgi:hypothetical protein